MENKHTGALSGVGFYATLVICLLAVGVGGYFLLFGGQETAQEEEEQKAAWEYLKFLTSADATTEWAMTTGYLPVRTSAYESETYQQFMATDPTSVAAYSQSAYFISQPAFKGSYDVMIAVNNTLEEQILLESDAQTTLDALVKAVNDILQK